LQKIPDQFLEQRINIKFCVKLGKNARDTCALVSEYYGGEAMKKSRVFKWHEQFKAGYKNVEDDERSGHPQYDTTKESVEKVCNLVHSDRRSSVRTMAV
jgi:hypothetical protein